MSYNKDIVLDDYKNAVKAFVSKKKDHPYPLFIETNILFASCVVNAQKTNIGILMHY